MQYTPDLSINNCINFAGCFTYVHLHTKKAFQNEATNSAHAYANANITLELLLYLDQQLY